MDFLYVFMIELVTLGLSLLALRVPLSGLLAIVLGFAGLVPVAADPATEALNRLFCIVIILASWVFTILGFWKD